MIATRRRLLRLAAGVTALPTLGSIARGQAYPSRPCGSSSHFRRVGRPGHEQQIQQRGGAEGRIAAQPHHGPG